MSPVCRPKFSVYCLLGQPYTGTAATVVKVVQWATSRSVNNMTVKWGGEEHGRPEYSISDVESISHEYTTSYLLPSLSPEMSPRLPLYLNDPGVSLE